MAAQQVVRYGRVVTFAGAFIAFLIGSGFATGQEVMQYFVSYGYSGLACAFVVFVLLAFVGVSFITVGEREKFEKSNEIYTYYCGKYLGKFFDYFSIIFIYMSFIVMIGGTGATFAQQYGLPNEVGGITMGVVAAGTVVFGLNRIVDVIGKIGPFVTVMAIFLGVAGLIMNPGGLARAGDLLKTMTVLKASEGGWIFAAGSYVGFCMLWLASFMAAMGKTAASRKEAALGAFWGATFFSLSIVIVTLGLLANLELVAGTQVPNLILANKITPILGMIFSIIVLLGIYTTAVPLLWTVCSRVAEEKTKKFWGITVALAAVGVFVGLKVPFDTLVNFIYVINGYVGILLLAIMVVKPLLPMFTKKADDAPARPAADISAEESAGL